MTMRTFALAAPLALAALVAGCGSSDKSSTTTAAQAPATTQPTTQSSSKAAGGKAAAGSSKVMLSADPSGALKFDAATLNAKAGKVTITMDNPSSVPHAIAIEGNGVDKDGKTVGKGGVSTVSAKLKPGTYTFYCPVPGHEAAGMKGTLTVT
jgi:plastocyanin